MLISVSGGETICEMGEEADDSQKPAPWWGIKQNTNFDFVRRRVSTKPSYKKAKYIILKTKNTLLK